MTATIETRKFVASAGREPKGHGSWGFEFFALSNAQRETLHEAADAIGVRVDNYQTCSAIAWVGFCNYGAAKKVARLLAREIGYNRPIYVLG